jgi:hypothetical protein
MIKITGKLIYDPHRSNFRKTYKQRTLIVQLPHDQLDLYYQWFLTKKFGTWMTLQRPMFGLHVTVVGGNEHIPKNKLHLWKKYHGQAIELEYDNSSIERHWHFWSMSVKSQKLQDIRQELGLILDYRLHITFGRQYDWMPTN